MMSDPASLRDGFKPSGELIVAARVSGDAVSAYPNGPPAGVTALPAALKESAKPLNVVVIADTDLLSDFMWVQQRNFFGQTIAQPFANNGELVWNALDNLGGSDDLISIRGRAPYSRPFERVEALRRDADTRFRSTEQQLQTQLQQTEEQLSKLQSAQPGGDAILSPEAAATIERFQEEKLRIRKELRKTKADLELDIKSLGTRMKLINVLADAPHHHLAGPAGGVVAQAPAPCHRHASQRWCGMNQKKFFALAATTVVVLAAGVWISMHRSSEQSDLGGALVFADLKPALSEITEVRFAKGDGSRTTLTRSADGWTVVERQFPADAGRVRDLALNLASLKVIESKTKDPANYARLGVESPDSPTATSTLVEVVAGKKTWSLIVGKGADGRAVYVRKPAEAVSVMAEPFIAADPDQKRWIDRLLTDVPGTSVHEIDVKPASGPAYQLTRATRDAADLTLKPVPRGRKATTPLSLGVHQTEALAAFNFDDVRAMPSPAPAATDKATYRTFDGQVIEFSGRREGEKAFVTVAVRRDADLAAKFAAPAPAAPAPEAKPAAEATPAAAPAAPAVATPAAATPAAATPADKTVERLGARATGLEFEIPTYKYDTIFRKQEELLEKPPEPAKK